MIKKVSFFAHKPLLIQIKPGSIHRKICKICPIILSLHPPLAHLYQTVCQSQGIRQIHSQNHHGDPRPKRIAKSSHTRSRIATSALLKGCTQNTTRGFCKRILV